MSAKDDAKPGQLVFDLASDPCFGLEDFLVSASNETAYRIIQSWPAWPARILLITGPRGAGKSHLAAIWAKRTKAQCQNAAALAETDLPALAAGGAVVIEDAERVGAAETALFHLLNLASEEAAFTVLTARGWPSGWGIRIPDLLSRLRQAPVAEMGEPDDALVRAVLVKLFQDRQLTVDTSVVEYVALHTERSLDAARALVAELDREALVRGRRITRSMAADVLRRLAEGAGQS
jgi:chromosomal replication initiation ATPase DnaA